MKLTVQQPYHQAIALLNIYLGNGNMFTQNMYMNVHSSFISNDHMLETTQMSFSEWMAAHNLVHLYYTSLLCNEEVRTIDACLRRINLKGIMLSVKTQS